MSDKLDALATLGDIAEAARAQLDPDALEFLDSGSLDPTTMQANRAAFGRWLFRPRMLTGIGQPDLTTNFLGITLTMPVLVAPFAGDTRYHPDGFLGVLNACAEHGVFAVVPELASWTFEDLARQVPNAARIAQVSLLGTEDDFKRLARRIAGAGYAAVCATVDTPVVGLRRRTHRPDPTSSTYVPPVNFAPEFGIDAARYFAGAHTPRHDDWTWTQLGAACAEVGVPFLVKGVLTPEDARAAADAGAVAVYVSNHGGRQLDSAPATLDQLPKIVDEVGANTPIAFDGGVRSGPDVVKALALGASVVLIGRLAAYGLAVGGTAGVSRVLALLHHEIETTMVLMGRPSVAALEPGALDRAP